MRKYRCYLIIICIFFVSALYAQEYKKVNINGKEYYQYQVEKSEGFYALTRKFGVTQEEVINQNPITKDGLKVGQVILIPIKKTITPPPAAVSTPPAPKAPTSTVPKQVPSVATPAPQIVPATSVAKPNSPLKGAFIEHVVEKKETVYSISQLYHVDIDTIYKYNPAAEESLKKGSVLKFPTTAVRKNEILKANEDNRYILYTVQEKETLYSISRKLDIPQKNIVALNPNIENQFIKQGDVLRIAEKPKQYILYTVEANENLYNLSKKLDIPVKDILALNPDIENQYQFIKKGAVLKIGETTELQISDSTLVTKDSLFIKMKEINQKVLKVAFLLPFMLNDENPDPSSAKFLAFYQGALVAIDSLKSQGFSVDVYVYDTNRSDERIKSILLKPALKTVDLIIGPAYTNNVKLVSDFAKQNGIRLIVPFSSKTEETFTNPCIYQCNISPNVQDEEIAKNFAKNFADKNIIIINFQDDGEDNKQNLFTQVIKELDTLKISYQDTTILVYDSTHVAVLGQMMSEDRENVLFVMTTNPAILSRIMPLLNTLPNKEFSMFGFPEWHQLAKTQEEIFIHDTYMYSSFYLDYTSPSVRRFFRVYSDAFGAETIKSLPHYSLLGYDITFYMMNALRQYDNKLEKHLTDVQVNTMQTGFRYERVSEVGGYMNKSLFLLKYKDGKEIKLKNVAPKIEYKQNKLLNVQDKI